MLAHEEISAALRAFPDDDDEPAALGQLGLQRIREGFDRAVDEDDVVRRAGAIAV